MRFWNEPAFEAPMNYEARHLRVGSSGEEDLDALGGFTAVRPVQRCVAEFLRARRRIATVDIVGPSMLLQVFHSAGRRSTTVLYTDTTYALHLTVPS